MMPIESNFVSFSMELLVERKMAFEAKLKEIQDSAAKPFTPNLFPKGCVRIAASNHMFSPMLLG